MISSCTAALLAIFAATLAYLYVRMKQRLLHWSELSVPGPEPLPLVGNLLPCVMGQATQGQLFAHLYKQFPHEPFIGYYEFLRPCLLVRDPKLIEKILIKDFGHFVDRGIDFDTSQNPIDKSLFILEGDEWRAFRHKVLPTFTSGKLKLMFTSMNHVGEQLLTNLEQTSLQGIDLKPHLASFTTDVIAATAFGIDISGLRKSDPMFQAMAQKALNMNIFRFLQFLLLSASPKFAAKLGITFTPRDVGAYFTKIIQDTLEHRKNNPAIRNDFVDLMLQLQKEGSIDINTKENDEDDDVLLKSREALKTTQKFEITDDIIVATAFIFLSAGFEGTAGSINFSLYYLCQNVKAQDKAREEILTQLQKHGCTYQGLKEMKYLDKIIDETQRIQPLAQLLFRQCTKDYQLTDDLLIPNGTKIVIPMMGLQLDPTYYPDPDKFIPERFDEKPGKQGLTYMPFGDGPRVCIGMRFAKILMKVVLVKILSQYKLKLNPKTKPLELEAISLFAQAKSPFYFDLVKL